MNSNTKVGVVAAKNAKKNVISSEEKNLSEKPRIGMTGLARHLASWRPFDETQGMLCER